MRNSSFWRSVSAPGGEQSALLADAVEAWAGRESPRPCSGQGRDDDTPFVEASTSDVSEQVGQRVISGLRGRAGCPGNLVAERRVVGVATG
jgi:hypothetical protein